MNTLPYLPRSRPPFPPKQQISQMEVVGICLPGLGAFLGFYFQFPFAVLRFVFRVIFYFFGGKSNRVYEIGKLAYGQSQRRRRQTKKS